jgi:hypothetical protein
MPTARPRSKAATFTPQQQAALLAITNCLQLIAKHFALDVGLQLSNRVRAITNVLVEKGVCDAADIERALRTVEAEAAILTSLDPEVQAALAELKEILGKLRARTTLFRRRSSKARARKRKR